MSLPPPDDDPATAVGCPLPNLFPYLRPPEAGGEIGRLGGYRVLRPLGRGGMGAVFAAHDPALRRTVALKVMLPRHAADPAARARFLREARAQASVEHDHVAAVYAVGEDNGVPFLAMPLLKGMPLSEAINSGVRAPVPEAVRVAAEVAEGLAAAHAMGLVHRDIKPGNIWLDGDRRRVRILDFGLARAADDRGGAADPVTANGEIVGTPAYMSPEQATGAAVDARTDLFSLGAVFYELLAGRRAFTSPTTPALLMAVSFENPPPPSAFHPDLPPALDALALWLLAKDPAGRPPSARAAADALRAAEADLHRTVSLTAAGPPPDPFSGLHPVPLDATVPVSAVAAPPRPARRPARWGVALGVLGLFTLAGAVTLIGLAGGRPDPDPPAPPPDPPRVPVARAPTRPPAEPAPAPRPVDRDRAIAEAVRRLGGKVRLDGVAAEIPAADALPLPPYRVTGVSLVNLDAVGDADLAGFRGHPLTYLNLAGTGVTDAGVAVFDGCDGLETLYLDRTAVGDTGAACFRRCKRLRTLGVFDSRVTDAGLAHFAGCPDLGYLHLAGTAVTNAGLVHFRGSPRLSVLYLDNTAVGDEGVAGLAYHPSLGILALNGTKVTDTGLLRLKNHRNLSRLSAQNTAVTATGAKALAAALPRCEITYPGGNVRPRPKGD